MLIPKARIAASFSKAALGYDGSAQFQREVGADLLALVPRSQGGRLLDLGAGTGALHADLLQHVSPSAAVASDLAHGMSVFARQRLSATTGSHWVTADAECMPFANASFDQIYANLSLQWCGNTAILAEEVYRILKPGGQLWYSTLLPGTLGELVASWAAVDDHPHVNDFTPLSQVLAPWQAVPLKQVGCYQKTYQVAYPTPLALLQDLKGIGAHFMGSNAHRGATPPRALRRMLDAYRRFQRDDGLFPATYHVLMLGLQK